MLTAMLTVRLLAQISGALDIERLTSSIDKTWSVQLGDGTAAGQANRMWSDTRTLASNTSESLDLNGTALTDAFGQPLALTKGKILVLASAPTNTTMLTVGNVANGIVAPFIAATNGILIPPGGMFVAATPDNAAFGITDATADLLKVANAAGAAANYDIAIIGVG